MVLDLGCLRVPSALQTSICKRRRAEPPPAKVQLKFIFVHNSGWWELCGIGDWLSYRPGTWARLVESLTRWPVVSFWPCVLPFLRLPGLLHCAHSLWLGPDR